MRVFYTTTLIIFAVANIGCKKDAHTGTTMNPPPAQNLWTVSTVAGDGRPFFSDGPALAASFRNPLDVAASDDGILFIADPISHRIRQLKNGVVSTFAGTGESGNTDGATARFTLPSAVITDAAGNVYTLDIDDPRVRKISSAGSVSSIAGNGQVGFKDGNAVDAEFGKETSGITLDKDGNIYVVDFDNKRIRKITPEGTVRTIAGNGITGLVNGNADQAEFFSPSGIAMDKQGNIYVGDDHQVRMISSNGQVSTYAGSATAGFRDGSATQAMFNSIIDLVIDQDGNLFLTDDIRIREVDTQGNVTTIAGSTTGYADGDGLNAKFSSPAGLTIDKNGNLFVADVNNNRIRKITTH